MTKRNIAIALFDPECNVSNSSWPRFTGFKQRKTKEQPTGLFGLVDGSTRMHLFFKNTDIQEVLSSRVRFLKRGIDVISPASEIVFDGNKGTVTLPEARKPDLTVSWLDPYTYKGTDGTEWDVYPVVTGRDIFIKGDRHGDYKTDGYWCMSIWMPKPDQLKEDMYRIEQSTINHVVKLGHPARSPVTYDHESPSYDRDYKVCDVHQDVD